MTSRFIRLTVLAMYTTIVSTDLLASHLEVRLKAPAFARSAPARPRRSLGGGGDTTESDWAIVDCRFDLQNEQWGREQYQLAHVPGAVYASLNADLSADPTGSNGRHPLPTIDALAATLGRLGLDRGTQVVAYDQDAGSYASRLWWLLRYLGHDAVAVLDGGWAKWVREGRPARGGDESRPAKTYTPSPRPELLVDLGNVVAHLEDPARVLIDARAAERFEGRSETIDRVAGHIPGARNHFFKQNLHGDGTMLPPDTLRATFLQALAGHTPADAVMYCGSGVTACQNLLAMEHAGLTGTRLYVGSWSEWSSDPSRAIETGPAKRK